MKSQQQPEATCLLAALAAFQADLARILDLLAARPTIAADASAAHGARTNAKLRGFFWTHEFAAVIGHSRQYVSDRCAARVIKTLKGGAPHRIPLSEEIVWNGGVS